MEDKSLAFLAGVGGSYEQKYKDIRLDNGDDKYGTNSTGEFICKTGKKGAFIREQFGKKLEVVVLAQRAKISKSIKVGNERTVEWFSSEFNPLNKEELIKLKKPNSREIKELTYREVLLSYPKIQGESGMKNQFEYKCILYLKNIENNEIYKLSLTGGSFGDWIEFKGDLQVQLWETTVILEAEEVKGEKYNHIIFSLGKEMDSNKIKLDVGDLLTNLSFDNPSTNKLSAPKDEIITEDTYFEENEKIQLAIN
jgi:hypothetical protein